MARSKTQSFVTELPLIVDSQTEAELLSRLQAGRQLYNACLNEAMVRMNLVRNSELYSSAKKISRDKKKERSEAFSVARTAYRYNEYALHSYATIVSNSSKWIAEKLDSNTQQTLASRAFKASERVLYGKAKKVRYKVASRFRSVEGKSNRQGIRWKNERLIWGKLEINPIVDVNNPVILHGLSSKVKYVRILWRELNGKRRWYVQLINEGVPYQKPHNYVSEGLIGLDLNINNIAYVGNDNAGLLPFAEGVPTKEKEIKRYQRQMERSRRANNPDKYEPDFKGQRGRKTIVKKGKCNQGKSKWKNSKRYLTAARKKRELERKKSAYAESQNRKLVNEILRHGNEIKTENVSVKGWQKRYGKAISAKSPGFFQSELQRKAVNANGKFTKFSTQKTALSQTHLNGERIKKKLSERIHYDVIGVVMHRDLFSAFLTRYVSEDSEFLLQDAVKEYPRLESVLLSAWERYQINHERVSSAESRQSHSPLEWFDNELGKSNQIAVPSGSERKVGSNS